MDEPYQSYKLHLPGLFEKMVNLKARETRLFSALENKYSFLIKTLKAKLHVLCILIEGSEQPQVMKVSQSVSLTVFTMSSKEIS